VPTNDFDSTDSYASTYLEAVLARATVAPDREWLEGRWASVEFAVKAMNLTRDADGLTFAKPGWPLKYLMDNVEVFRGLQAAAHLAQTTGRVESARRWEALAQQTLASIETKLGTPSGYAVSLNSRGRADTAVSNWYPGVMAQLMAVAWLPPSEKRSELYFRLKEEAFNVPVSLNTPGEAEANLWWAMAGQNVGDQKLVDECFLRQSSYEQRGLYNLTAGHDGHRLRLWAAH
jgi:hypothetical protein